MDFCTVRCTKDSRSWEWHVRQSPQEVFQSLVTMLIDIAPSVTVKKNPGQFSTIQADDPLGSVVRWEVKPISTEFTSLAIVLEQSRRRVRFSKSGDDRKQP